MENKFILPRKKVIEPEDIRRSTENSYYQMKRVAYWLTRYFQSPKKSTLVHREFNPFGNKETRREVQ